MEPPQLKKMVEYGREHPINESSAVVSVKNNKLQKVLLVL
jgi:hypothetical protein